MKYFADNGHEVHLITSTDGNGDIGSVRVHRLKRIGPKWRASNYLINAIPLVIQFNWLVGRIRPDIIHVHQIMDTSLLGALSGFHPFVATPWGSDVLILPQKSRMQRWMVKYVLKRADLITCDAEHIKEPLVKLGADPQKIRVIYFGTDTRRFTPEQKDERLRQELGLGDSPVIISLRRLEPIYDIESLIRAVPLVLREFPRAKFLVLEKGSQEELLKQLAQSLGVAESVIFVGRVPADELPRYVASADIYVSTSLSDAGLAASTAEAMASGLPVIITDFGDNRKWVEDGVNGFIVPLKAPEALASKIIYLLKDGETRQRFGRISREIILERNDWEKEMGKMGKLYKELVEKHKKR